MTQKSEILEATATGEAAKQHLGVEEAHEPNSSMVGNLSADGSGGKAQLVEENLDNGSRPLEDDSYELNQMELTVDQYGGGIASKDKDLQGAAEERLKYLFDPARDAVEECGDKACFTCCSGSRVKESNVPLQLLHRRLSHFDSRAIEKMVDRRVLDVTLSDRKMCECAVCKAVEATRRSVPKQREYERVELKPWERVWTDLKGKPICGYFYRRAHALLIRSFLPAEVSSQGALRRVS